MVSRKPPERIRQRSHDTRTLHGSVQRCSSEGDVVTAAGRVKQRQPRRRVPKRATAKLRRKPPEPKLGGRPDVVVLGRSALSKRVSRAVRDIGAQCRRVEAPDDVAGAVHDLTRAVVVVPPIPAFSILAFARRRDDALRRIPLFVVMEGPLPEKTVRKLYRDGIEAVFEWPSEAHALRRTMFRLCAPEVRQWGRRKSPAEIALEETARARLGADAVPFGAALRVEACRRFIVLKGSLDAIWKLELARQVVSEIPGVDDVVAEAVHISGQAPTDRAVARAIREVLRHASGVESTTLAVAVRDGQVTLTGSVKDKQEAARALELVRQVRGVSSIQDYLVVSAKSKERDAALARRVRSALKARYPDWPVNLSVFGDVAVLSGRIPRAAARDQLTRLVRAQRGVERVVDKLAVKPAGRRA